MGRRKIFCCRFIQTYSPRTAQYLWSNDSIILIHVSNRYVNLAPVLGKVAQEIGAKLCRKYSKGEGLYITSVWMMLTWDDEFFSKIVSRYHWEEIQAKDYAGIRTWTDRYSSILPVIHVDFLIDALKHFRPFSW